MSVSTIPSDELRARVERLRERLVQRGLDGLVVHAAPPALGHATRSSGNVRYLTGWSDRFYPTLLVVPRTGEPVLLVLGSPLDARWLSDGTWLSDVRVAGSAAGLGADARALLDNLGLEPRRVGVAGADEMFLGTASALLDGRDELVRADDLLSDLKRERSASEVELQRQGAAISDAMIERGLERAAQPGAWAHQVMADMEHAGRALGADFASSWVAWGTAPTFVAHQLAHAMEPLQRGERVQVGTYVIYGGYWAHAIRVATHGPPAAELQDAVDRVRDIQDAGFAALRPGASLREVVRAMQERAEHHRERLAAPADGVFVRFGHALGLQYAEPVLSDLFPMSPLSAANGEDVALEPGMVFELHPNLSTPSLGWVSLGDMAAVTDTAAEWLTAGPRDLIEL